MTETLPRGARRKWYNPAAILKSLMIRPKVFAGLAAGAAILWLLPEDVDLAVRATLAWVAGGSAYLGMATFVMWTCSANAIRSRAAIQDDSGIVILFVILLAIGSSFVAIAGLLSEARAAAGMLKPIYLALAAATIFISWSVTQIAFAFHYAHEYYAPPERQSDAESGLEFPRDENPDYWDFLYFSTAIGATSQTSDTSIRSKSMRRLVTLHSVVAFFFNTMMLALTINLAAGLI